MCLYLFLRTYHRLLKNWKSHTRCLYIFTVVDISYVLPGACTYMHARTHACTTRMHTHMHAQTDRQRHWVTYPACGRCWSPQTAAAGQRWRLQRKPTAWRWTSGDLDTTARHQQAQHNAWITQYKMWITQYKTTHCKIKQRDNNAVAHTTMQHSTPQRNSTYHNVTQTHCIIIRHGKIQHTTTL